MFFKKKKEKTPKTSNRKVVPNMKPSKSLEPTKILPNGVAISFA